MQAGARYDNRDSGRLISVVGSDIGIEEVPCILRCSLIQEFKALRHHHLSSASTAPTVGGVVVGES